MGADPEVTAVLLQASDETTGGRLAQREHGDSLTDHMRRSTRALPYTTEPDSPG
ncbi:hypothetical protein [Corynebacterium variabile]|uniref:hypothetical protein n=1 Tax=Corynebacterium variabile TaxID=1727 RepID=UPI001476DE1E|nr:hypothetical protein [Corynebacterium variabile]MDN6240933.1 hypothetical protein [Corynebacterium variabile]MDN6477668.1 hypothetical protein [Corynebacterium variabile]MDN6537005.1 hypothetical protein [Corynebacterium variabile]MDN6662325.1 hypothetical protein [Corynebacterium variabile]MDN6677330.1 hypothetical protein [Corynebacterium variabile]